jgi:hypothetical protein
MIWPYGLGEIWTQMNLIPWIKCTAQKGKWGAGTATSPFAPGYASMKLSTWVVPNDINECEKQMKLITLFTLIT